MVGQNGLSLAKPTTAGQPQEGPAVLYPGGPAAARNGKLGGTSPLRPGVAGHLPAPLGKPEVKSEMRGLVRDMATRPPVDVSKVERLAQAVQGGSFKVDAGKLADAMIASLMPEKIR